MLGSIGPALRLQYSIAMCYIPAWCEYGRCMHHFISPLGDDNSPVHSRELFSLSIADPPKTEHRIVTLHINPTSYTTPEIIWFAPSSSSIDGMHSPTGNLLVAKILLCGRDSAKPNEPKLTEWTTTNERTHTKKFNRMANLSWGFHYIAVAHQKRKIIHAERQNAICEERQYNTK